MVALKLSKVGNSIGAVLPKEVLARMKVGQGDTLYLTETPDGYRLTPSFPTHSPAGALNAGNMDLRVLTLTRHA